MVGLPSSFQFLVSGFWFLVSGFRFSVFGFRLLILNALFVSDRRNVSHLRVNVRFVQSEHCVQARTERWIVPNDRSPGRQLLQRRWDNDFPPKGNYPPPGSRWPYTLLDFGFQRAARPSSPTSVPSRATQRNASACRSLEL